MKKMKRTPFLYPSDSNRAALLFVASGFFLGGLFGCIFAGSVSGSGSLALSTYIQDFIAAVREGTVQMPGVLASTWSVLRWPLITVLLSFSVLGVIGIPVLFFVRGFLFSFCVASFVQVLGGQSGLLFAFLLLGVESLLSIPVLFLFGTQGIILASQARAQRGSRLRWLAAEPAAVFHNAVCILILLFCTLWEILFAPMLLSGAATLFPV